MRGTKILCRHCGDEIEKFTCHVKDCKRFDTYECAECHAENAHEMIGPPLQSRCGSSGPMEDGASPWEQNAVRALEDAEDER